MTRAAVSSANQRELTSGGGCCGCGAACFEVVVLFDAAPGVTSLRLPAQGVGHSREQNCCCYWRYCFLKVVLLLRGGRVARLQLAVLFLWFVVAEPGCGAAV